MSRYHHSPFQILSEFSGDDLPLIERRRCCRSDLNEGPVSNECECDFSVRKGTAHDEMIVAMHQNSNHTISCFDARIVNRMADGEMVHHVAAARRRSPGISITDFSCGNTPHQKNIEFAVPTVAGLSGAKCECTLDYE